MPNEGRPILVFFTPPEDYENVDDRVKIIYGALPTTVEDASINFSDPVYVTVPGQYDTSLPVSTKPVHDEGNEVIVWGTPVRFRSPKFGNCNDHNVFHFGKRFDLLNTYRIPNKDLRSSYQDRMSSAIVESDTGLIALGSEIYDDAVNGARMSIFQRRGESGQDAWIETPIRIPADAGGINLLCGNLFHHQHRSSKTVYYACLHNAGKKEKDHIYLYTIPSSVFSQLYKGATYIWRRTDIQTTNLPLRNMVLRPLITYDQEESKCYLWIFQALRPDGPAGIQLEYMELDKDGTVPGDSDTIKSAGSSIDLSANKETVHDFCVSQWSDKVLLTWTQGQRSFGRISLIKADGQLQLPLSDWQDVKLTFKEGPDQEDHVSISGVIVDSSFLDD